MLRGLMVCGLVTGLCLDAPPLLLTWCAVGTSFSEWWPEFEWWAGTADSQVYLCTGVAAREWLQNRGVIRRAPVRQALRL